MKMKYEYCSLPKKDNGDGLVVYDPESYTNVKLYEFDIYNHHAQRNFYDTLIRVEHNILLIKDWYIISKEDIKIIGSYRVKDIKELYFFGGWNGMNHIFICEDQIFGHHQDPDSFQKMEQIFKSKIRSEKISRILSQ